MSLNLGKKRRESDESPLETSNGAECLDHQLLKNLADLIEKITTTGRPSLDEQLMKEIKKICKISDAYVDQAFHLVTTQLHMGHCEIRLSAFQVIDQLFNRSHHFRELLVTDMQEFMEYCVETDPDCPLPPPKAAAKNLKESALRAIQQWQNKFGKAYKKLTLGYNFLKFQKKINFDNIEARSAVQRQRAVERENRKQLVEQQKLMKILQKMQEKMPEIEQTLMQMENCFELLLPRQTIQIESDTSDDDEEDMEEEEEARGQSAIETNCNQIDSSQSKRTNVNSNSNGKPSGNATDERTSSASKDQTEDCVEIMQEDGGAGSVSNQPSITMATKQEPDIGTNNDGVSNKDNGDRASSVNQVGSQHFTMESEDVGTGSETSLRQQHGLPSRDYNLTIRVNTDVQMTINDDNQAILNNLDDHYKLISTRFLPEIGLWMATLGKSSQQQDRLKKCIDVKQALKGVLEKYRELRVQKGFSACLQFDDAESSDSDEEFEDVPEKEGYEPFIPEHLRAEYGLEPLSSSSSTTFSSSQPSTSTAKPKSSKPSKPKAPPAKKKPQVKTGLVYSKSRPSHPLFETEHTIKDPASQAGTMADLIEKAKHIKASRPKSNTPLDPKKQQLLAKAPVVPFGVDLEYWEDPDQIQVPTIIRPDSDHLVWSSAYADEEIQLESVKNSMQTRVMSYAGSFTPVKWKCRAPQHSGKLCDRMDRVKCPFHGKIIGRDKDGIPTNPDDLDKFIKEQEQAQQSGPSTTAAFDDGLQEDIEAALGIDQGTANPEPGQGGSGKGKGRGGKKKGKGKAKAKKYPNLTDIKKVKNTSRMRLENKILNKRALSRVANAMTRMDNKIMNDKFGNNFTSLG